MPLVCCCLLFLTACAPNGEVPVEPGYTGYASEVAQALMRGFALLSMSIFVGLLLFASMLPRPKQ